MYQRERERVLWSLHVSVGFHYRASVWWISEYWENLLICRGWKSPTTISLVNKHQPKVIGYFERPLHDVFP